MKKEKITRREFVKRSLYGVAIAGGLAGIYACTRDDPRHRYVLKKSDGADALQISKAGAPKPNIIIINCDDLGYGDIGSYGNNVIRTLNIDRFAREGVRFTDFYAASPVCTPSRFGLLTGRYPIRSGLIFVLPAVDEPPFRYFLRKMGTLFGRIGAVDVQDDSYTSGIPHDEITLADALRVAGYRTGMVGKWHLGDFSKRPEYNPGRHGFDEFFGVPHSNDIFPCALYRNEKQLEANISLNQERLTGLYTKEAVNFINNAKDKPFFLYFAHTFPHQPLFASEKFKDKSRVGIYGDVVEEIDWSVGEVLNSLKRNGIEKNTIVFFTSDNGPWYNGSPGGLRGRKGQSYEGGFRVPLIVRWPGRIRPGSVCSEPAMNIDLFPTLLSLAGLELPEDRIIDGKNIYGLLTGKEKRSPHQVLFFYHYEELEGVRTGRWKYFRNISHYVWPQPVDKKTTLFGRIAKGNFGDWPNLYDFEYDRGENYNVYARYPAIGHRLEKIMADWEREIRRNPRGWK
jgi:arylsulfatase A